VSIQVTETVNVETH